MRERGDVSRFQFLEMHKMTDYGQKQRASDSWSSTEVRSLQHNHMWIIKGFGQCECRYLETTVKIKDRVNASNSGILSDASEQID